MPQELLFELSGARITPHVATFGGTSYQIAAIGSVRIVRRKKYNPLAVITFLVGVGIVAAAIVKSRMTGLAEEYFSMAATGVAVMVAVPIKLAEQKQPRKPSPWFNSNSKSSQRETCRLPSVAASSCFTVSVVRISLAGRLQLA
jgi:hypothetical protein